MSKIVEKYEDFWYAALVRTKCENMVARQMAVISNELDIWVASRKELRQVRSVVKKVEVVLLPSYVFFRFPAGTRLHDKYDPLLEIKKLTDVYRLVQAPDHSYGEWEGARIPNVQMDRLKFVLEMSDKPVYIETERYFVKGDRVRVIRGNLIGLEGTISRDNEGHDRIYIEIDKIGYASTEMSRFDVEFIRRGPGRPRKQDKK